MESVKALEVALSDGTGCLAELEVQTITYLLPPLSLQCLHPCCVNTALLGRTVPDEVSDTHCVYFPLKPTVRFKSPEDTGSSDWTSHLLDVGVELNNLHQPSGPIPQRCPLEATSCMESSKAALLGCCLVVSELQGEQTAVDRLQKHKLFPK